MRSPPASQRTWLACGECNGLRIVFNICPKYHPSAHQNQLWIAWFSTLRSIVICIFERFVAMPIMICCVCVFFLYYYFVNLQISYKIQYWHATQNVRHAEHNICAHRFGIYVHLRVGRYLPYTVRYVNHIISFFFSAHTCRNCDIFVQAFHAERRKHVHVLYIRACVRVRSTLIRYLLPVPHWPVRRRATTKSSVHIFTHKWQRTDPTWQTNRGVARRGRLVPGMRVRTCVRARVCEMVVFNLY